MLLPQTAFSTEPKSCVKEELEKLATPMEAAPVSVSTRLDRLAKGSGTRLVRQDRRFVRVEAAQHSFIDSQTGQRLTLYFPEIAYQGPGAGESAQQMAEKVLGRPLGKEIDHGGMRRVFVDPSDPSRVIKIYDPSLSARLTPQMIAGMVQREVALERFLSEVGIRVAKIDRSPRAQELWKRGIILQEIIKGTSAESVLPKMYFEHQFPKVVKILSKIRQYDSEIRKINRDRFGVQLSRGSFTAGTEEVGIDLGSDDRNLFIESNGDPVLIDW